MSFNPNPNQEEVINFGKGNLLVEAGPGSGKTTVIVERIIHLIDDCGVDPESFLVITFTRKAADNLKNKLKEKKVPKEIISKMQISTIHSFCYKFLKDRNRSITLLDDDTEEKKALFIDKFSEKLGFTDEKTLFTYQVPAVVKKFGEYSSFKVNYKELSKFLEETNSPSEAYVDFIDSLGFFSKRLIKDKDKEIEKNDEIDNDERFSKQWYKARYLQISKAYPKYLKLLDDFGYVDYDTLQSKTLDELKSDSNTKYECIIIDEFQDTDPLQFEIFKILMEGSEYFTAVGDIDQHIYAFRSSYTDYFKVLCDDEKYGTTLLSLNTNYRSTENIVKLTEEFIDDYRKDYSQKHMLSYGPEYNNSNFIIESDSALDEAENICNAIKCLKSKGVDYNDISVLYRKHNNATVPELIKLFRQNGIDFSIHGHADLVDQDEVKSVITLLWYIARRTDKNYFSSEDELKDKNLKQFCTESDEDMIWSLKDETKRYLIELEEKYCDRLLEVNRTVPVKECERNTRAPHKIPVNRTSESLAKIFSQVDKPVVDLSKINDSDDREFFRKLDEFRCNFESDEPKSILTIFYELLSLNDYFESIEDDPAKLYNLAILTQTISNYESFISETDIRGLYFFLTRWIKDYSSYYSEDGGVQLMTVHAAKGLEFPVTIVSNLEKGKFPMAIKDPERKMTYINGTETFYTPARFLKYKDIPIEDEEELSVEDYDKRLIEEENKLDEMEELHIVYVAMTRAADLLILSCVGELPPEIENLKCGEGDFALKQFTLNDLNDVDIEKEAPEPDEEALVMNYSKYTKYCSCPFKYNLGYNMGFTRSGTAKAANRGTAFHNIMEYVNLKLINQENITQEELNDAIRREYGSMFDIDENIAEYNEFKNNVIEYYNEYSVNRDVLEAEYDFEIDRGEYIFNGSIDLIYKTGENEITILDYKYAEYDEEHIDGYKKQLHLYAAALKALPEYKDYKIKEAITHFVLGDYQHKEEITDEIIDNELKHLDEAANEIKDGTKFIKKFDTCDSCSYRTICSKKN